MYRDLDDFQQKYPTKEAKVTALKTMSNEEIDELIDLCQTVQGKLWYQRFKKSVTIFRYELKDAWGIPVREIEVIDGPKMFVRFASDAGLELYMLSMGKGEFTEEIRLQREDLMRIREILDNDRLFEQEELERAHGIAVLDGYIQTIEISCKGRYIKARGANMDYCEGDFEHCFHTNLMIRVIKSIGEILIPLGVLEECFSLTRE